MNSASDDVRSAPQKPSTLSVGIEVGIAEGRADGKLDGYCVGRGVRATPSGRGEEVVGILVVGALVGSENGCLEGWEVGCVVGMRDGMVVGCPLGTALG